MANVAKSYIVTLTVYDCYALPVSQHHGLKQTTIGNFTAIYQFVAV